LLKILALRKPVIP